METTRLRESRAYVVQYTALKAITPFHRPTPKIPAIAIDSTKAGKAWKTSVIFIRISSRTPPANPARIPTSVPTRNTIPTIRSAV